MRGLYAKGKRCLTRLLSRGEDCLAAAERKASVRAAIFFALLAGIGVMMYLLNVHTPLVMDDYDYMYSWATGETLSGLADVIRSQIVHYQTWGGRSVNHTCLQVMAYLGKDVFNVVNTLMYLLLLLEIYMIARPKGKSFSWPLILTAHLALFTMVPFFGMVFLWMTGACNYLWGTVLALLPAALLRSVREGGVFSRGRVTAALLMAAGFIAGWTNENVACGMIALVFARLMLDYLEGRKVSRRLVAMGLMQCAGALCMLLAPGNGARMDTLGETSLIAELVRRLASIAVYGASYMGAFFAVIVLLAAGLRGRNARTGEAALLLFGAVMASLAMVGSPVLSDRTFTGAIALTIAAMLVLLGDLFEKTPSLDAAKLMALPALLAMLVYTGYHALGDVCAYEAECAGVVSAIEQAAEAGESEVVTAGVSSHSRFTVDVQIMSDPEMWPNTTLEKHFGVRVIGGEM